METMAKWLLNPGTSSLTEEYSSRWLIWSVCVWNHWFRQNAHCFSIAKCNHPRIVAAPETSSSHPQIVAACMREHSLMGVATITSIE